MKFNLRTAAAPKIGEKTNSREVSWSPYLTKRNEYFPNLLRTADLRTADLQVREALSLVAQYAAEYHGWINAVIDEVVVLDSSLGDRSGSDSAVVGIVCLSLPSNLDFVVEGLVHEAAHQHYYLAEKEHGLFVGLTPDAVGYSPILKKRRPIEKILLAYHAVANTVLLLNRANRNGGGYLGSCYGHVYWLESTAKAMEMELLQQEILTEKGDAFFNFIRAQLKEFV